MQNKVIVLDFEWSEACGHFKSVGSPHLFAWVRTVFAPGAVIADGRVVVLARQHPSHTWTEFVGDVTLAEASALVQAIVDLGLHERGPRADAVVDTSDVWFAVRVHVAVGESERAFTVHTQSSGFSGPDAEALRAIFRRIFRLAGYEQYDAVLYGREATNSD